MLTRGLVRLIILKDTPHSLGISSPHSLEIILKPRKFVIYVSVVIKILRHLEIPIVVKRFSSLTPGNHCSSVNV